MSHFSNNPFGGLEQSAASNKPQGGGSSNKKKRKKNKKKAAAQAAANDGEWATVGRKGKKDSGAGMGGDSSNGASGNGAGAAYTPRFSLDDMSTAAEVLAYLDETSSTTKIFYRLKLWRVWTKMLASGNNEQRFQDGGREVLFRELFLRSRAVEQTVESVLREPIESEDEELAALFSQCLTGTPAFHNKLVKHLRDVADALPRNSDGAAVVSSSVVQGVAGVVGSFKQHAQDTDKVETRIAALNTSIKQRKNQLKHVRDDHADKLFVLGEKTIHSGAVLELEESRLEALQTAAINTNNSDDAAAALANAEVLFAQLQESVQTLVSAGSGKGGSSSGGSKADAGELQKRLQGAAAKRDGELKSLRTAIGELSGEEDRLVARKKQLESELEKVRSKLNEIGGRRERLMVQEQQVKGTYLHEVTQLEAQMAQSGSVGVGVVNEAGMKSSVGAFVKCMRDASAKKSTSKPNPVQVHKGDIDRYESAAEKHLALEQERLQLLVRVVGVYSSRLSKLRGERDEMLSLGLSDVADGLNDDIAKIAAQEEQAARTVDDIKRNVARAKASLASLFPASGSAAAPKRVVSKLASVEGLIADVDAAVAKAAAAAVASGGSAAVAAAKKKKKKAAAAAGAGGKKGGKKKQQRFSDAPAQQEAPVSVAASDLYDSSSSYVVDADASTFEQAKKPAADEWEKVSHHKKKEGANDGLTEEERIRMLEVMELKARRKREKEEQMERAEAERAAARRKAQEQRQRALAKLADKRAKQSEKPWSGKAGAGAAAAVDDGAFPTAEASKDMPTPERAPQPLTGGAAVRAPSKSKKPIRSIAPKPVVQSEPLSNASVGGPSRFQWKVKDISAFSTKEEKDQIKSDFAAIQIVSKDGTVAATVEPSKPAAVVVVEDKKADEAAGMGSDDGAAEGTEVKTVEASEYLANDSSAPFEDGGEGMEIGDLF